MTWKFVDPGTDMGVGQLNARPADAPKPHHSFGEVLRSEFYRDNTAANFIANNREHPGSMTHHEQRLYRSGEFNPLEAVKDTEWDDPIYRPYLTEVKSQRELEWTIQNFEKEKQATQVLDEANTLPFAISAILAGSLDPVYAPTYAIPMFAGTAAFRIGATAAVGGGSVATTELMLHQSQPKRTLNESLFNVGAAGFLSGILGGVVGTRFSPEEVETVLNNLDIEINSKSYAGMDYHRGLSAQATELEENFPPGFLDDLQRRVDNGEISTQTAAIAKRDKVLEMTSLKYEPFMKAFKFATPQLRVATSRSVQARMILENMVEDSWIRQKNQFGLTSGPAAETLAKYREQTNLLHVIETVNDSYEAYLKRVTGSKTYLGAKAKDRSVMTKSEFSEEIGMAQPKGDVHDIPEIQQAAQTIRSKVTDPMEQEMLAIQRANPTGKLIRTDKDGNIIIPHGDVKSYHRVFDFKKIIDDTPGFEMAVINSIEKNLPKVLRPIKDELEPYIQQAAEDYIAAVKRSPTGYVARTGAKLETGEAKATYVDISSADIQDFLVKDVVASQEAWLRAKSPQVELAARFDGDINMIDAIKEVRGEYNKMANAYRDQFIDKYGVEDFEKHMTAKEKKHLRDIGKEEERIIKDIEGMRDMLLHKYAKPEDPASLWTRAGRFARELNFMNSLGGMTVASIPDLGSMVMRVGLRPLAKTFTSMVLAPKTFNFSRRQAKEMAAGLDAFLYTRSNALGMLNDAYVGHSGLDRFMSKAQKGFAKATGMPYWNAGLKQWAGVAIMHDLGKMVRKAKLSAKDQTRLAAMHISKKDFNAISAQWQKHGVYENNLHSPNTDLWDDLATKRVLSAAVLKEVDSAIVTPGVGDLPLFAHTAAGKLIFQFKTFMMTAHNRIFLSGVQRAAADPNVMFGYTMMAGLGVMSYGLKEYAAGREPKTDFATLLREGLDKSGMTGYMMFGNSMTERMSRGELGLQALIGGEPISRYKARSVLSDLLGPSYGTASDARQALSGAIDKIATGEINPSDIKAARRLLPYQNLIYARRGFDLLQEGAQDTF